MFKHSNGLRGRRALRFTMPGVGAALAASLVLGAPVTAASGEEGQATDSATGGGSSPEGEAKRARMRVTDASPRRKYLDSRRKARFQFKLGGDTPRTLIVKVRKLSDGKTRQRWRLKDVEPGELQTIRWNGRTRKGRFTRQGKHAFRVYEPGKGKADMSKSKGNKRVRVYGHRFPVRGNYSLGDGFGAGRNHQGVDVFTRCGKKLRAVRGGKVTVRASHSRAGKYIVVRGRGTGRDYVYMHMQRRGRPKVGDRVRTGEPIGFVGATGNASGCHLHFEMWSPPGWYEGGRPNRRIKSIVKRWASWS